MIIGNKTLTTRYILPFLFNDSEIFKDEYKFINAYIEDINRPYLDNHVMVVFEYDTKNYQKIDNCILNNPYYCNKYNIYINNVYYIEYVFIIPPIYKKIINIIKDGYFNNIDESLKLKIIDFWKNTDLSYLKDLLHNIKDLNDIKSLYERNEKITEEDPPYENTDVFSVFQFTEHN